LIVRIVFEETLTGYTFRKHEPTTAEGRDLFNKCRGSAESDMTSRRIRRLGVAYLRNGGGKPDDDRESRPDAWSLTEATDPTTCRVALNG
jgi:hypothetical protein